MSLDLDGVAEGAGQDCVEWKQHTSAGKRTVEDVSKDAKEQAKVIESAQGMKENGGWFIKNANVRGQVAAVADLVQDRHNLSTNDESFMVGGMSSKVNRSF